MMRDTFTALFLLLGIALPPAASHVVAERQPSSVIVTVVDGGARYPLANADITDLATSQHHFTNERGQVRLTWPSNGELRLRVREIGYQPSELTLRRSTASDETTTVALSKVAYVISPVKETAHCATTTDSASLTLSVAVLDQLKQGAEKYDQFRKLYPFETTIERRTAAVPQDGTVRKIVRDVERFRSDNWEPSYRPGDIIDVRNGYFTVPVLFLSTLADSVFWEHHCFVARGLESFQGARLIRLEFSPASDVHGPDWEGTAFIDSSTSALVRVNFKLANPRGRFAPKRLEGYTTFSSPSPYVIMPDTTGASWWMRSADYNGAWGQPDFIQLLYTTEMKYRGARPPGNAASKPSGDK